jgi:hypothetical protein
LTFSSWDGLELPYSMVLLGVILMELWSCGRTCEFLWCSSAGTMPVDWELLAPGRANLLLQLLHWVDVVLTTPHPSHGDWAACKQLLCLSPRLDLILSTLSVTLEIPKCWVHNVLYQLFKNRYLTWSIKLDDANGNLIAKVWEYFHTNPNTFSSYFFCFMFLLQVIWSRWRSWRLL